MQPRTDTDAESVDLTLRHVTHRFPEDLARALLPHARTLEDPTWLDTQYAARERRVDKVLSVRADGHLRVEHTEWQMCWTRTLARRVFEYHAMITLGLHEMAKPGEVVPKVRSTVVLLQGRRARPWPTHKRFRTAPREEGFSGLRLRVEPVYQRTVQALADQGSPLWMIFAPLAVDATEGSMLDVLRALRSRTDDARFGELAIAMAVLADADTRARGLRRPIEAFLPGELTMRNFIYDRGLTEGLQQGRVEGRVEVARALLLETLRTRSLRLGPAQRARIAREAHEDVLTRWFRRALVAQRTAEIFVDPA
ncbi:MAG: hypothetical protein U0325_01090 [Polyangiales bacterium]